VTDALTAVPGVIAVAVDLGGGTATVESRTPLDPISIDAAIDAAGYETEWAS
jgi:copper chaperone CopZ